MQFNILTLLTLAMSASAITVSYDTIYDDAGRSINDVACSDGINGLKTRYGWQTLGAVARFPNIGGAQAVAGWNSPNCGTCWKLEWQGKTVTILAVDRASAGFNIGKTAMNTLTGGRAEEVGRVDATATQVDIKQCGL